MVNVRRRYPTKIPRALGQLRADKIRVINAAGSKSPVITPSSGPILVARVLICSVPSTWGPYFRIRLRVSHASKVAKAKLIEASSKSIKETGVTVVGPLFNAAFVRRGKAENLAVTAKLVC